jgi:hypothetical protein
VLVQWKFGADVLAGLFDVEIPPIEKTIGFAQGPNFLCVEASTLKANLIDTPDLRGISVGDHVRGDILDDLCAATENRVSSNAAVLMHAAESANDRVVFDNHMTGQSAVVGENDVVPDDAIMGNVRVREKVIVTANDRFCLGHRPAIDGAKLSKAVLIADLQICWLSTIFEVLAALAN